jgi:predicted ferric reductase
VSSQTLWYVSRATGLVSLALLTLTAVLGALNTGRFAAPRWPRFVVTAVHRNISLVTTAFLVVHITTAIVDSYAGIGWLDAVIPFGSIYHPVWLGFGAIAFDLLIALVVSSLLRVHLTVRLWRAVHWAAYLSWPLAVTHGLGIGGSDTHLGWVLLFNCCCVLAVVSAVWWRLAASHPDTEARAGATEAEMMPR